MRILVVLMKGIGESRVMKWQCIHTALYISKDVQYDCPDVQYAATTVPISRTQRVVEVEWLVQPSQNTDSNSTGLSSTVCPLAQYCPQS